MKEENTSPLLSTSKPRSKSLPVSVKMDRTGRAHFRPTISTAAGAARFRNFQIKLLNGTLVFNDMSTRFAANLIAFDGIATHPDLMAVLALHDQLYTWNEHTCLEWAGKNKRVNRRFISIFTKQDWTSSRSAELHSPEEILNNLEIALEKAYPTKSTSKLEQLLHDAQTWMFEVLPGPIFAHCLSLIPLAALPREVLAREESHKALLSVAKMPTESEASLGFAAALGGYFSHDRTDHGGWLLNKLVIACRHKKQVADHIDKHRILKECLALSPEADLAGRTASLILAWAIDLVESGTASESNLSPGTIDLYVKYAAPALHECFKNEDIEEVDAEKFSDIYTFIIKSASPGVQKTFASALSSWHQFIQYWLDATPIKKSLYSGIEESAPRANVLWPHEKQLIETWISAATGDERLINQLQVSHAIATACRIRISELLKLRMRNIRAHGMDIEIEISPMRRDGKLKTLSAQRVTLIHSGTATTIISKWVDRRKSEGALLEDLFFGDPHKPDRGYKLGQLCVTLNQLLKSATGDPKASFHIYSHDWISNKIAEALLSNPENDINPLDNLAAEAGHFSSQTSLIHYFHFIEGPLRHFLDCAIQSLVLTSSIVSRYSNLSPASLRQQLHRSKQNSDKQNLYWLAMANNSKNPVKYTASSPFEFENAHPPSSLAKLQSTCFSDMLHMLSDLSKGMSVPVTSSRCDIPESIVYEVAVISCNLLKQLGILDKTMHAHDSVDAVAHFQMAFLGKSGEQIRFDKINQNKLDQVRVYLTQQVNTIDLESACISWANCYRKGYISLDKPSQATGLIKFLHETKGAQNRLVICTSIHSDRTVQNRGDLPAQITAVFKRVFALPPFFDAQSPRRGRPNNYLVISGIEPLEGNNLENASISMRGFNALLFAAFVHRQLNLAIMSADHKGTRTTNGDNHD